MFSYVWPIALLVFSNTLYQVCAKEVPAEMNTFASLTITYLTGAAASGVMLMATGNGTGFVQEYDGLNWASLAMGLVIVGLEAGWIYTYKAGWPVSTAFIVQSAVLAGLLLIIGYVLYREPLSWNKIAGVVICLAGLYVLNYK